MKEVAERLREQGLEVRLTDASRQWLARKGFDPQFGARPLRRTLQRHVESPLSIKLLRGDFDEDTLIIVDVDEEELTFEQHTEWKELSEELTSEPISEDVTVKS
jgi:ATP-dependent Clp protease ATP-binding subunit ClpC